jgi:D-aminoacyl-tRNA deacylase
MIAVVQRVSQASVTINKEIHAKIASGFVVLLGINHLDNEDDVDYISRKIVGMRILGDEEGKMNLDIQQIGGDILLISQFTLYASTKKGNRPSFIEAARPEIAILLYEKTKEKLEFLLQKNILTGIFGADMQVSLLNDGPVTIILDSKNRN